MFISEFIIKMSFPVTCEDLIPCLEKKKTEYY